MCTQHDATKTSNDQSRLATPAPLPLRSSRQKTQSPSWFLDRWKTAALSHPMTRGRIRLLYVTFLPRQRIKNRHTGATTAIILTRPSASSLPTECGTLLTHTHKHARTKRGRTSTACCFTSHHAKRRTRRHTRPLIGDRADRPAHQPASSVGFPVATPSHWQRG